MYDKLYESNDLDERIAQNHLLEDVFQVLEVVEPVVDAGGPLIADFGGNGLDEFALVEVNSYRLIVHIQKNR